MGCPGNSFPRLHRRDEGTQSLSQRGQVNSGRRLPAETSGVSSASPPPQAPLGEGRRGASRPHLEPRPRHRPLPQPRANSSPHLPAPSERNCTTPPAATAAARGGSSPSHWLSGPPVSRRSSRGVGGRCRVALSAGAGRGSGGGHSGERRVVHCDVSAASLHFFFFLFSLPLAFSHSRPLFSLFLQRYTCL